MEAGRTRFRTALWWALNRDRLLVAAGLVLAAGLLLLLAQLSGWTRSGDMVVGKVVGFGLHETDLGTYPVAVVQLKDIQTRVILTRSNNCRIGDDITLRKRSMGLMSFYATPCTHTNTPPLTLGPLRVGSS